jgi:hypothetical protein
MCIQRFVSVIYKYQKYLESITEDEIRNIVKNLSNNKDGGYDRILNEYIKFTIDQCIYIYVKLFNLVLILDFSQNVGLLGL